MVLFFVNIVTIHKDDIYDHIRTIGRNYSNLDDVTENMTVGRSTAELKIVLIRGFRRRHLSQSPMGCER